MVGVAGMAVGGNVGELRESVSVGPAASQLGRGAFVVHKDALCRMCVIVFFLFIYIFVELLVTSW